MDWKVGDWAVFDREIVQIKRVPDEEGSSFTEVSDGTCSTSGSLLDRLRPLTLRNKRTAEWFAWHYRELNKIRGERGFNYPDISRYFSALALEAMDGPESEQGPYEKAQEFLREARDYKPMIHGINLFRAAA